MRHARAGKISVAFLVLALLAIVGVPGGFYGYKLSQRSARSEEVRMGAPGIYRGFDDADHEAAYLGWLVDKAHPAAFDEAYATGGLFKPASFDEAKYNRALAKEMVRIARAEGGEEREVLADNLDDYFGRMAGYMN